MGVLKVCVLFLRAMLIPKAHLAAENLALRQQLAAFKQSGKRPRLRPHDRIFWVWSSRVSPNWRSALAMGIEEVPIAARSPWQNPYCERVIGSIRRECLNHLIVLNERHLHRILTEYFDHYHNSRPHLSLDRNSPSPREMERPSQGKVLSIPQVGGLHHRYTRRAA